MKTSREFDYNLWKDSEGNCFVGVKSTGEILEVNIEVFRLLKMELMRAYRWNQGIPVYALKDSRVKVVERHQIVYFDEIENDARYSKDISYEFESGIFLKEMEMEIKNILTEKEYCAYLNCVIERKSTYKYAQETGVSQQYISKLILKIRQKIKKII